MLNWDSQAPHAGSFMGKTSSHTANRHGINHQLSLYSQLFADESDKMTGVTYQPSFLEQPQLKHDSAPDQFLSTSAAQ